MPTNYYRLHGAPHIFPGESISSWLQRLSQQQGVSIKKLFSFVGAKVPNDVDAVDLSVELAELVTMCNSDPAEFNMVSAIGRSIQTEKLLQRKIRKNREGRPISAYCAACLNTDRIPYYRIEWRFSFWKYCPEHESPMVTLCGACQQPLVLDKTILFSMAPPPSLAFCRSCLSKLADDGKSLASDERDMREKISVQRNMMASILKGYCMIVPFERQFPLHVMIRLHQFGMLLSAVSVDFDQIFDPETIHRVENFLKKIQFQISWKELVDARASRRSKSVIPGQI